MLQLHEGGAMTETDIEICQQAVATAYLWIARARSNDLVEMEKIRDLQLMMEEVWIAFQELFP
jgi:hypothetical protein